MVGWAAVAGWAADLAGWAAAVVAVGVVAATVEREVTAGEAAKEAVVRTLGRSSSTHFLPRYLSCTGSR